MAQYPSPGVNLERRLAQLEGLVAQQQRRLRVHRAVGWSAALVLAGGAMTAAVAQQTVPEVVQAQRLEIVSADGKLMMTAGAGEHGGRIELMDHNGSVLMASNAGPAGGQVDLWNAAGRNVMRAACNVHGGDIAIWNAEGRNVMGAYATARGGETALWSSTGQPVFRATTSEESASGEVTVFSANGTESVTARGEEDGCGLLSVFNNAGNAVFTVDGLRDVGCAMALYNNVGTRLFLMGTRINGTTMDVMNDRGEIMGQFGVAEDGGGAMTLRNASGMEVVLVGSDEERNGRIMLRDATNAAMRVFRPGKP